MERPEGSQKETEGFRQLSSLLTGKPDVQQQPSRLQMLVMFAKSPEGLRAAQEGRTITDIHTLYVGRYGDYVDRPEVGGKTELSITYAARPKPPPSIVEPEPVPSITEDILNLRFPPKLGDVLKGVPLSQTRQLGIQQVGAGFTMIPETLVLNIGKYYNVGGFKERSYPPLELGDITSGKAEPLVLAGEIGFLVATIGIGVAAAEAIKAQLKPLPAPQPSRGEVDVPLPTSIPELENIESVLKEPIKPLGSMAGFDYPEGVTQAEKEAIDLSQTIETATPQKPQLFKPSALETSDLMSEDYMKGFDLSVEQKVAINIEMGKITPKLPDSIEHLNWSFPLSIAEQAEPLKLMGSEETLLTPESLRAIMTAETLGVAPKTSMIDPFIAELEAPPTLTRPIPGMPFLPSPELTARIIPKPFSIMPQAQGFMGITRLQSGISESLERLQKLDLGLSMTSTLASSLSQSSLILTEQSLEQSLKAVQIQIPKMQIPTLKIPSPTVRTGQIPRFDSQFNLNQNLFKPTRRRKGSWEKGFIWEFPVKGPRAAWKKFL